MKQKTVSSAAKRVRVTGSGKLMRSNISAQHLSAGKSKRTRAAAGKFTAVSKADLKKLKRLIPNR